MHRFILFAVTVLFAAGTQPAFAVQPTWAKKATAFPEQCDPNAKGANDNQSPRTALSSSFPPCIPVSISSPDGNGRIEVKYRKGSEDLMIAHLEVTTPDKRTRTAELPEGFQNIDLLWSPDSKAFFVSGGEGGVYWGFWVYVYLVESPRLEPINLTYQAQRDMLRQFPPCKAAYPNSEDASGCKETSRKVRWCMDHEGSPKNPPDYNMTGIDWVSPSTILVMAEIPCSSSRGGIMCQIMGYELEVPTGRILRRIDAKDLKLEWQKSMAWEFRIPDPPLYCK
jgi:hypothetical protein